MLFKEDVSHCFFNVTGCMSSLLLCKIDFGLFFLLNIFIFLFFHVMVLGGTLMVLLILKCSTVAEPGRFLGTW